MTSFLCSLKFLLFHRIEYHKEVSMNTNLAQFLWYDWTFKRQCTVPVTLTFEVNYVLVNWVQPSLHTFQIDISSNSREIKYQNIGRTHTQTDRVKTIPRNPLRGRGNQTGCILLPIYPFTYINLHVHVHVHIQYGSHPIKCLRTRRRRRTRRNDDKTIVSPPPPRVHSYGGYNKL